MVRLVVPLKTFKRGFLACALVLSFSKKLTGKLIPFQQLIDIYHGIQQEADKNYTKNMDKWQKSKGWLIAGNFAIYT